MAKNEDIDKLNYSVLESLKKPITLINVTRNCRDASKTSTDKAQVLPTNLRVCA